MGPGSAVHVSLGSLLEMQIPGPTPDPLAHQKLWVWPAIYVLKGPPGDLDAAKVRNSAAGHALVKWLFYI